MRTEDRQQHVGKADEEHSKDAEPNEVGFDLIAKVG
jgi:hypothetical protein